MYSDLIHPEDTIAAIATPQGTGALGLIRLSGKNTFDICNKVFKGKKLGEQAPNTIHYGHIVDGDTILDEVMVSVFKAPKSFTAEDSVEIACHGSSFILSNVLDLLIRSGARMAAPGEFTIRAYLNGRIDLAQAEAVADVIASGNSSQLNLAMNQMRGGLSDQLSQLRERLLNFISLIELELDFGEEDVEFADRSGLRQQLNDMQSFIRPMIDSFKLGNAIKNGIPVAIVGRPNAGKSSLLNALLNDDRAIVSDIAGTTRDTIEEEININGVSFRFIDTAGIRQTEDIIEKIGIEKALKTIDRASVVIYIFDANTLSEGEIKHDLSMLRERNANSEILVLGNKSDLLSEEMRSELETVLFNLNVNHRLVKLKDQLHSETEGIRSSLYEQMQLGKMNEHSTIISNARHQQCLRDADEAIHSVLTLMDSNATSDLLALEMRRAVNAIGDITGTITNDEVLGNIFGKFCIGK